MLRHLKHYYTELSIEVYVVMKKRILTILMMFAITLTFMPTMAFAAENSGQWEKTGSGNQFFAEFPSGYNTGSSLYSKYHKSKLSSYENETAKRVVTTTRISYIYWHWAWRIGATADNKYNFFINDSSAGDESHGSYPYFSDFESTSNYSMTDPYGNQDSENRCGYMWRNNPDVDGSWWWYQIPVYKQTYTDYKWVSSPGSDNTSDDGSDDSDVSQTDPSESSDNESAKYTPKKTNVNNCTPKKKSCTITFKKCPSKCTGYQIRYCTNKKFKKCIKKTIKGRSNCSVKLKGLKAGTKYYYQVRCYRVCGKKTYYSSWTKCRSFTTKKSGGKDPAKARPKKTSVTKCTPKKKSCTITYKRCSGKCTGYQIRYCTNKKFRNCKTKTIKGRNNLTCTLSGLRAGTTYYYQIRCYRKVGNKKVCSGWSKCRSFKTKKSKYSTKKGIQYQIIKHKNKVYCGVGNRLVEIDLKTKKTKTLATTEPDFLFITDMCIKNGYLYYYGYDFEDFWYASLHRVKLNGKNKKLLHSGKENPDHGRFLQYRIINKKIYLLIENETEKGRYVSYSMNLDGSNKRVVEYFDDVDDWSANKNEYLNYEKYHKMCNVKGYSRRDGDWKDLGENGKYRYECDVWLYTPKGKIKVGKYSW